MTDLVDPPRRSDRSPGSARRARAAEEAAGGRWRGTGRVLMVLAFAALGFVLMVQLRGTDDFADRLAIEREEDLAAILSELNAEADRLQDEITELRLTLLEFETSAEREELARRSLEQRYDDLRILIGSVDAEGEGVVVTVEDGRGEVTQDALVVAVQELRDAGAEAIAIDEVRLVASSAVSSGGGRLLVDGTPLESPYRLEAVGPAETIAAALQIPGGAVDTLERSGDHVTVGVEVRDELRVPAVSEVPPLVFGRPVADSEDA